MSRIAFLARHPRRSLTALATLVAAGAVVVGSGAVFSTQTANPSNTFASGILSQGNDGSVILSATNIVPGASHATSGTVDIQNSGTVSGVFSLAETITADQDSNGSTATPNTDRSGQANRLSHALHLTIVDCGKWVGGLAPDCLTTTPVYNDVFDGVGNSQALSTYAAGEKRRYKFTVYLPDGGAPASAGASSVGGVGDNAFSGAFTSATFTWNAVTN